jgi:predicted Na+-dependent transporter
MTDAASTNIDFPEPRILAVMGNIGTQPSTHGRPIILSTSATQADRSASDAQGKSQIIIELAIAIGALVICVFQFWLGRRIGRKLDDTVAGGQGLGQKNTVLAIWMAQMYLNPLSSIGPGAYVLWQNSVNSWQIWRQRRNN